MRMEWNIGQPLITVDCIVPEYDPSAPWREAYDRRELPLLFLLHGVRGSSGDWLRYSMLETYARDCGIVIVCPNAENSFYVNWENHIQWETAIMKDLWDYVQRFLPVSDKREKCFIAGLSMGGYGAMHYALSYPERFSFAASFSGAVELPNVYAEHGDEDSVIKLSHIFGDRSKVLGSEFDLFATCEKIKAEGRPLPEIYLSCGTRDCYGFHEPGKRFYNKLTDLGYKTHWDEADYDHEWRFWDIQIEKVLKILSQKDIYS